MSAAAGVRATDLTPGVRLGLGANRAQFALLVLINAFVGAMVGLERTVLPLLAQSEFGLASAGAVLSFIASFGLVKAVTNFFAGRLSDRYGRRRVLLAGWLLALPVPVLIIWAPAWSWVIGANALLGASQGLAWSSTVIMKIDLVGPERRGFAMGLNEFAGYLAAAGTALATGYIAQWYGLRPAPFYLGLGCALAGLGLSLVFVRDTWAHAAVEARLDARADEPPSMRQAFAASWRDPVLGAASQAGLVNNLNDGVAWGLLPLFFAAGGLDVRRIGILAFSYPAVWGVVQLWTGALSDRWGRKPLIAAGMLVQGVALAAIALLRGFGPWLGATALLGFGTAMVYPTLLAAVGDVAPPRSRGSAIGAYRFWRDAGYAAGALFAGALADGFGMAWSIAGVALLTGASGLLVLIRMPETLRAR